MMKRLWSGLAAGLVVLAGCGGGSSGPSDGSSPQVRIDAPTAGATVGGQVSIDVTVTDDFGVDQVRILIDGTLLTTIYSAPYHVNWNTSGLTNGSSHVIRVEALDAAKNVGTSQISVTVQNGVN